MTAAFLDPPGISIEPASLRTQKARALVAALARPMAFADFVETRADEHSDVVVVDVEVQLPREPKADIRRVERIAVAFDRDDQKVPRALALRADFPLLPHQNLADEELPRDLCLFDERYEAIKPRWTPTFFIDRLRGWLRLSARRQLHADDQPLEPFISGSCGRLILTGSAFQEACAGGVHLHVHQVHDRPRFWIARPEEVLRSKGDSNSPANTVAVGLQCRPKEHGVIRRKPGTLQELAALLDGDGFDTLDALRTRLRAMQSATSTQSTAGGNGKALLEKHLLIVVWVPKLRNAHNRPEAADAFALITEHPAIRVGLDVGAWEVHNGIAVPLVGTTGSMNSGTGSKTRFDLVDVSFALTRADAASLAGRAALDTHVVAVGAGALGSQTIMNLIRSGFGRWTIVDDDVLLPHNVARHALPGTVVGRPKAHMVAVLASATLPGEGETAWIQADVLKPGDDDARLRSAAESASLVLDMSASAAVARHLAIAWGGAARRASIFLSPSGKDLVMIAEDVDREVRLDALEAQFYRSLLRPELSGYLCPGKQAMRYGQSCRDRTMRISQEFVAMHAAIAAMAVQTLQTTPSACVCIWRAQDDGSVQRVEVEPSQIVVAAAGGWSIIVDSSTATTLHRLRQDRLPSETGGVLMGSRDMENRILYVTLVVGSPPDSDESRSGYLRGCQGLSKQIEAVERATECAVLYLGEWHSHPEGASTAPSAADADVFRWLADRVAHDGVPALIAIVGRTEIRFLVGLAESDQCVVSAQARAREVES
jgi:integrative and conjugative element protein (TIGR02256 family)